MSYKNYKRKHRALANQILVQILLHPESHDQSNWGRGQGGCGTNQACVAGHAAILTGNASYVSMFTYENEPESFELELTGAAALKFGGGYNDFFITDFFITGKKLLGLNNTDAAVLFFVTSNEQAVRALAFIAADKKIDWEAIGIREDEVEAAYAEYYEAA